MEITESLMKTYEQIHSFYQNLSAEKLEFKYAEGKWTPKEILQHVMDTERIFSYRALRFARMDTAPLPGYEQDDYVMPSKANQRSLPDLLEEYKAIRRASITLFKSFDDEMWQGMGVASENKMSARAAAAILPGHELHHLTVIKERYL